jgi:hypothetical protein
LISGKEVTLFSIETFLTEIGFSAIGHLPVKQKAPGLSTVKNASPLKDSPCSLFFGTMILTLRFNRNKNIKKKNKRF